MGTELFARGVPPHHGVERVNLLAPELVKQVHADYIAAGSRVIGANTFAANRPALARYHADDQLREIILAGVRLARDVAPSDIFVAGAVGPLPQDPERDPLTSSEQVAYFTEMLTVLLEGGVDLVQFESFTDLAELCTAITITRSLTDLPIVAQMAFETDGCTVQGIDALTALLRCTAAGADVMGANCGHGAPSVSHAIRRMASAQLPLSAYLNAGFPEQVEGRLLYHASDDYLAQQAIALTPYGVRLLGGCCGTRPSTIHTLAELLTKPTTTPVRVHPTAAQSARVMPDHAPTQSPSANTFPIVVEVEAPAKGTLDTTLLDARAVLCAGATALTVADNPLAAVRADACQVASLLQQACGAPVIPHLTGRDRNRLALRSSLLGARLSGIRAILCVTGDPIRMCQDTHTSGVFDVTSIGLVRMVAECNATWQTEDQAIPLRIGVALNPNVRTLSGQLDRLRRKVEAGANFALSQPIYDIERFWRLRDALAAAQITIPVYVGLLPLVSARHADFLHNEVPGIDIPQAIRTAMARHEARADQQQVGVEMLLQLLDRLLPVTSGIYGICPRHHAELLTPLLARASAHVAL
jgi:homocysteine S-methyltransferase